MKICHIIPNYYPFKIQNFVNIRAIAQMGHEVDVLALGREEDALHEESYGITIWRIPRRKKGIFIINTAPYFIHGIQRILAHNGYDLIHVYSFRGCSVLPLINIKRGFRWILDIRTGNISGNSLRANMANWLTKIESRAFQEILLIDSMIAEKVLSADTPYTVIPLGADFNKFRPARDWDFRQSLQIEKDDLAILFSSSLAPQRYPEIALEAFRLALPKSPRIKLLIVGDGPSRKNLEAFAMENGFADRVVFTGFVPFEEMPKYVAAADIGLGYVPMTPQYDPQPPLKTVEYLAGGLPVVATKTKGNMRFVQDEVNGLLCEDDPQAIADQIVCMATQPVLREEFASRARISVEHYDWNRIVKDMLLPVYQRVLEAPFPVLKRL